MSAWIAGALALPAFTALSLAMERHQDQVLGRTLPMNATLTWRLAGTALLGLSLASCLASGWSAAVATAAWFGVLSASAMLTGALLTYVPRHLPRLAGASLAVGALAFCFKG